MINLMPPNVKQSIKYARLNVSMIYYCSAVLILSAAISGVLLLGVNMVRANESDLTSAIGSKNAQVAELGDFDRQAKSLSKDIQTIAALFARSVDFAQLIQDIGAVIPNGARLTDLSLTGEDESPLQITAITRTQELAAVLRQNIEDSAVFAGADIQSISASGGGENAGPVEYSVVLVVQFADPNQVVNELPSPNADIPEEEQD